MYFLTLNQVLQVGELSNKVRDSQRFMGWLCFSIWNLGVTGSQSSPINGFLRFRGGSPKALGKVRVILPGDIPLVSLPGPGLVIHASCVKPSSLKSSPKVRPFALPSNLVNVAL